jgi:hypothetical protein
VINRRLLIIAVGALSCVVSSTRDEAAARGLASKASVSDAWTPTRVRSFVLEVEREMQTLERLQAPHDGRENLVPATVTGTCRGEPITEGIEVAVAIPRIERFVSGKVLPCYVATYLGCTYGRWIARSFSSFYGPDMKPFTRSKVTIIEQTPDRVVADVVEAAMEAVTNGVIGEWDDEISKYVEPTDEELNVYKDVSRYTITRGSDGVWRISDRKPPFKWECRPRA